MCLIVFAYKQHSNYDFILAANRDEAYERPTRAAQFWDDYPDLLAGKDLLAGGTWMGINRNGRFAALTNYRDPSIKKDNPPSRGKIVCDYLIQEKNPASFLKELNKRADQYMGFNLLAGSVNRLFHYSNQEQKINLVAPGIHGLSNHLLDTPWPKVERAKNEMNSLIKNNNATPKALFDILQDEEPAEDELLPATGLSKELEKKVSPIFITSDDYGTRNSTILLIDKKGNGIFEERRYKKRTMKIDETNRFEFKVVKDH